MWHLVSKNVRVNSEYKVPPSKTLWVSIIMMSEARVKGEVVATWVEACFCDPPPGGNGAYWEEYFELLSVNAAHSPRTCRHEDGTAACSCCDYDCTKKLEERLRSQGESFL